MMETEKPLEQTTSEAEPVFAPSTESLQQILNALCVEDGFARENLTDLERELWLILEKVLVQRHISRHDRLLGPVDDVDFLRWLRWAAPKNLEHWTENYLYDRADDANDEELAKKRGAPPRPRPWSEEAIAAVVAERAKDYPPGTIITPFRDFLMVSEGKDTKLEI